MDFRNAVSHTVEMRTRFGTVDEALEEEEVKVCSRSNSARRTVEKILYFLYS